MKLPSIAILLFFCAFIFSCDGGYHLTGKVYEIRETVGIPIDSVSVKVFVGKKWFNGQTFSDSTGFFEMSKLSTPFKAPYYFIFERNGFKPDTIFRKSSRGHSEFAIEQVLKRIE